VRRIDGAIQAIALGDGSEPPKPDYQLIWPAGLDEFAPDIAAKNLPLQLAIVLADFDTMRSDLAKAGAELAISSFVWNVREGMKIDSSRAFMYSQLNHQDWPYRYADIRRMADFQNRIFARYAAAKDLFFIDEVAFVPTDMKFFMDAVHFNRPGTRIQAWGIFNALVPWIRERVASSALPRPARDPLIEHPNIRPPINYEGCADWIAQHPAAAVLR